MRISDWSSGLCSSDHARPLPPGFADLIHERLARAFELELRAIEGIAAVVDALACPVCVASSSGPERLSHSLTHAGLLDRFAPHVFSGTRVPRGKPAPDLFLHAARSEEHTSEPQSLMRISYTVFC